MCWLTFAAGMVVGIVLAAAFLYGCFWLTANNLNRQTYWEGGFEDQ